MTNKPPRPPSPPSLSQYRPSNDRPGAQQGAGGGYPTEQPGYQGHQIQPGQQGQPGNQVQQGQGAAYHDPRMAPAPGSARGSGGGSAGGGGGRSSFGLGTILLYALVAIIAVFAAGLTFLIISPPTDLIRSQAIKAVKERTGRDLTIKGPTSISFYPSIGITMGDVALGAPPDMGGAPLVKIAKLTVAVKVLPLLSREVVVDTLILTRPQFDLRVDANGRKTWDFARAERSLAPTRPVRVAQAQIAQAGGGTDSATDAIPDEAREFLENSTGFGQSQQPQSGGTSVASLEQLRLGDVRIIDGTIRYTDAGQNVTQAVSSLNVSLELPAISAPFKATGDLKWKGETIDYDVTLTSLKAMMEERPAKLVARISARPVTAAFDGTIKAAGELVLDGALNADAKSLRALAGWLGTKLPKVDGFGPLTIQGRMKAKGPTYSFLNAKISLDGALATGNVTVATAGVRPHVRAKLKLSALDLNKYMTDSGAQTGSPRGGAGRSRSNGGGDDGGGASGPQVRGFAKRSGWSSEPIDLSSLGAVDADADLTVGQLLYKKIKVDRSRLNVKLKDRVLRANLTEMVLYKGSGRGIVTVDATKPKSAGIAANFAVSNVSAQPLLTDAAEISWLSGTGNLNLELNSRGSDQLRIVKALSGVMSFKFVDGAIVGFNLPKIIRSAGQGQLSGIDSSKSQQTDFSELSATFNIKNGIASNSDLQMLSPLLRVSGAGRVFLPTQTVDYTIKPKLVGDLQGQGGAQGLSGIVIPVRIHGPFSKLAYTPDLQGILSDPGQVTGVIRQLGDQLKGKNTGEIIDGILGGLTGGQRTPAPADGDGGSGGDGSGATSGESGGTATTAPKKKKSAQEILDDILGGNDGQQDGQNQDGGSGGGSKTKKLLEGLFGN